MFDSNENNVYGGYQYNPQFQQSQVKQVTSLTPEEYEKLSKQENPFNLSLTETEKLRGICNHRTLDGMKDTLVQNADGSVQCTVCGYVFRPTDNMTKEDVKEASDLIIDVLQTIKLLFIDMPVQTQREFFQIIPLIGKIPELFDLAVKNFSKHDNYNSWAYRGQNMGTMNLFNMLSGALNQPYYGQPQQQYYNGNPAYGYQQQPQQYYQAPQQNVPNGMPVGAVPPTSNGFGYPNGAPIPPMGGYAPQTQGYQYNPQPQQYQAPQQTAQPGTTAPTQTTATTDGNTVNTQATFTA